MRIELPREAQRFGANLFYGVQKVYELDAGLSTDSLPYESHFVIRQVPYETINGIEKQMAIIVPMKNERLRLLEGILFAIPHPCLTIVVSNSPREPVDRYNMERNAIENFCTFTKKPVVVVHQKDPAIAAAFAATGYSEILDDVGLIKDGKAEGMILGMMLARLAGKKYIGFVDADNYIPGAVFEYVRAYATGFALSQSPYSMVRMLWHSKPKVVEANLYFVKYGRASVITNDYLNRLISYHTGFETEVIKTGNAGEHALTTNLALLLDYASGYAIEPYHFINLIERFGGVEESPHPEVMKQGIDVYQIESRNPHLHASKGESHVQSMISSSLQAIYHSTAASETLKHEILVEMRRRRLIGRHEEPAQISRYRALAGINPDMFAEAIERQPFAAILGNAVV
ncbi:MAG TPA: mannosyl-3-phosphoglycerate synthase [Blastocatellia bacterium]|nr:mannosyl-3-phosphoglycerate synthase [Blastocatellia bacterium]